MKPGASHAKGSAWEREVGKLLSLWLTDSARDDIFSRNVLSGGAFTLAHSKGVQTSRMPGDLMAAHPLAFQFLSKFLVECKHLASLRIEAYIFDERGKSTLAQIIALSEKQAKTASLDYMVIAKQNNRSPLLFVASLVGKKIIECCHRQRLSIPFHALHRGRVYMFHLSYVLKIVPPGELL